MVVRLLQGYTQGAWGVKFDSAIKETPRPKKKKQKGDPRKKLI